MKTLKQQITEGILDQELDINFDLIEPADVMCEDSQGRWNETVLRANEDILAPLAAQKFNAVLDAVKEYENFRQEYHYTERPVLFGQILKLKPKTGTIDKAIEDHFNIIARFNKWIESAGKTKFKQIISSITGTVFFNDNTRSRRPSICWEYYSEIDIDDTLIKKLNSIDPKIEVKMWDSDGEYFISARLK